jgi:hypothetical protein
MPDWEMPIDPRSLASDLAVSIPQVGDTNSIWTRAVKARLVKLAKKHGLLVSPDPSIFQGEYLLDVIWQKPAPCADLLLACESEWGDCGSVWEDFEKLMHVKASLKLMIFCTGDHEKDFSKIRKGIESKYMAEFTQHLEGETYILLEFTARPQGVHGYEFIVPPTQGRLDAVRFHEFPLSSSQAL